MAFKQRANIFRIPCRGAVCFEEEEKTTNQRKAKAQHGNCSGYNSDDKEFQLSAPLEFHFKQEISLTNHLEFAIEHTWDSNPVDHDPIKIIFSPWEGGLKMQVSGPFFNDPAAPPGPPGHAFPALWNYEVVEAFFLDSTTENYLEVEVCPHGQHLILLLSGVGQAFVQQLPMVFSATITGDRWMGEALIPWGYFPPNVNKMNSYAIHGSGEKRTYEALYSIPKEEIEEGQQPNFHLLQYFQDFRLQSIMGDDWIQPESELWNGKP